jgi:hypothetical protein
VNRGGNRSVAQMEGLNFFYPPSNFIRHANIKKVYIGNLNVATVPLGLFGLSVISPP